MSCPPAGAAYRQNQYGWSWASRRARHRSRGEHHRPENDESWATRAVDNRAGHRNLAPTSGQAPGAAHASWAVTQRHRPAIQKLLTQQSAISPGLRTGTCEGSSSTLDSRAKVKSVALAKAQTGRSLRTYGVGSTQHSGRLLTLLAGVKILPVPTRQRSRGRRSPRGKRLDNFDTMRPCCRQSGAAGCARSR